MATVILASAPPATRLQYHLPEAARLAIVAQSPASKQRAKIEQQRLAFIQIHGSEFGAENSGPTCTE